jgi:hypothetical protein
MKQEEYCLYKARLLEDLTKVRVREYIGKIGDKEYPMIYFETMQHPMYTKLRERCYRNGIKQVTSFMMKHLGLEGIAIWAVDDGSIEKGQLQIATNSFSEAEHYFMKEELKKKGLYCSVGKRRQYYYLRFSTDSTELIMNKAKEMKIPHNKVNSYDRPPKNQQHFAAMKMWANKRGEDIV